MGRVRKKFRTLLLAAVVSLACVPAAQAADAAPQEIRHFHKQAYALTLSPPDPASFRTVCETDLADRRVSFIAAGDGPVIIAAITAGHIADPRKDISTMPAFFEKAGQPGLSVTPGPVADWGYVWDRNRDGRIDYLAYLIGPNPVKPKGASFGLPAPGKPFASKEQYLTVIKSLRQVFWHMADEDFDGEADAFALMGRESSGWWRDWFIVSTSAEVLPSGADAFECSLEGPGAQVKCEVEGESPLVFKVQGQGDDLTARFPAKPPGEAFDLLQRLQKATARCNFKAGDIRH